MTRMSTQDQHTRFIFAGVDEEGEAPDWFVDEKVGEHVDVYEEDITSFSKVLRELPRAVDTEAGYLDPQSGEWRETDRHNAIVDPDRVKALNDGAAGVDPLWHIPTGNYTIINPVEGYDPLCNVLREHGLADSVYGEVRTYRGGGEVHIDLLIDPFEVYSNADDAPVKMGLNMGYDFFGSTAFYSQVFAQQTQCVNSIEELSDRQIRKHVGDSHDFRSWWEHQIQALDTVSDTLSRIIREAEEFNFGLRELPFGVEEFYDLLGFPDYIGSAAESEVTSRAEDPFDPTAWDLHSGATYALTHEFQGGENGQIREYNRTANDILYNPAEILGDVEEEYERRVHARDGEDNEGDVYTEGGIAEIATARESVQDKVEEYESREEELRALVQADE